MPKINDAGLQIIKEFEGCRLAAYPDPETGGEPWTIGYGHTGYVGGEPVQSGMTITQTEAEALLQRDLQVFEVGVNSMVDRNLTSNQFSALVSLAFNIGLGALRHSTLMRYVNAGEFKLARQQFSAWIDGANPGLIRRRAAEAKLFGTP